MTKPRITAAARVQRLLAILQWAASFTEGAPVEDLCARFELSPEELVKELDLAMMVGGDSVHYDDMPFEVFVEDGRVFVRLFSFRRPMRLTPAEGLALVASAGVLVDRKGDGALARALDKLAAMLGIEPGQSIDVDLDPDGGLEGRTLREAIAAGRQVAFTYWTYGRDTVGRRVVDPWEIFSAEGSWYLAGWAHDAGDERRFRLDRMESVEIMADAAETIPPVGLARSVELGPAPQVVLDLAPRARWVAEAHPVVSAEPAGERLRVTLAVSGPSWLERLLVRLGPDATVVRIDDELGDDQITARTAERVLRRYRRVGGVEAPR